LPIDVWRGGAHSRRQPRDLEPSGRFAKERQCELESSLADIVHRVTEFGESETRDLLNRKLDVALCKDIRDDAKERRLVGELLALAKRLVKHLVQESGARPVVSY
jgi:hypothetical protein